MNRPEYTNLTSKAKRIGAKSIHNFEYSVLLNPTRAPLDAFSSGPNHILPYQTMTKWTAESISTFRGSTEGSFVRKVWNWLQMVVHRLLGESMGSASMKVAMLSRQCSIVPPAGRLFLLFKPWRAQRH